jgi:hypothetical protein
MRKLSAKWVPKCLKADQKRQLCQSSEQLLEFFRREVLHCAEFPSFFTFLEHKEKEISKRPHNTTNFV